MQDLSNYRKSYDKSELLESAIRKIQSTAWFHEIKDLGGTEEVNAVTVATIGLDGFPKSRVVLLKVYRRRIYFYTNYNSEKARRLKRTLKYVFFFGIVWNVR
jgi:pyridoxamine 5'-phosphate oxidase